VWLVSLFPFLFSFARRDPASQHPSCQLTRLLLSYPPFLLSFLVL
jgi:hypothetical protein